MEVNKVFIKGDCHGSFGFLDNFCFKANTTKDDILIILGDAGINYNLNMKDIILKEKIKNYPITLFCIHGNHEERPYNIPSYKEKEMFGGIVYVEDEYPNIIFAKDGENYKIGGHYYFVLGGAYSVDKNYRLARGWNWFESEQPDDKIKKYVQEQIRLYDGKFDIILSHTAPLKYEPVEMFLPMIDQSKVDKTTEKWLNKIEDEIDYNMWYFGHYHGDYCKAEKIRMLFNDILTID